MIIDVITGIIHEQNGWGAICGKVDGGYAKVVDTNAVEGDNIFCEECFKEKPLNKNVKGLNKKEMKDEQTDSTTKS